MRAPMVVGLRKSKGVPSTGRSSPVGMRVLSTGVNRSADMVTSWFSMSPLPARLK